MAAAKGREHAGQGMPRTTPRPACIPLTHLFPLTGQSLNLALILRLQHQSRSLLEFATFARFKQCFRPKLQVKNRNVPRFTAWVGAPTGDRWQGSEICTSGTSCSISKPEPCSNPGLRRHCACGKLGAVTRHGRACLSLHVQHALAQSEY